MTVIVPSKRWTGDCEDCLDSLGKQDYIHDSHEVIFVIDNDGLLGGDINTSQVKDEQHGERRKGTHFKVVRAEVPGISGARNKGASLSRGEYLAFIDSDSVASSNWLTELINCALQNNSDLVVGRVVTDLAHYLPPVRTASLNLTPEPFRMNGCSFLCKQSVFNALGGFSPDFAHAEDYDLGIRAIDKGFRATFCNEAVVFHKLDSYGLMGLWRLSSRSQAYPLLFKSHPQWTRRYLRMLGPFSLQSFSAGAVFACVLLALVASWYRLDFAWALPLIAFSLYSVAYSIYVLPPEAPKRLGRVFLGASAMLLFSIFTFLWKAKGSYKYRTLVL